MSNPWFRLYSKIMTDPVVEFLSFEDQRHYIWILCMKNDGVLDKKYPNKDMREKVIARRLGLQGEAFQNFKERIFSTKLVNKNFQPAKWNDLQFKSDSSKERVKAYRERKKVEKEKQECNVTVTPQDTDKETEAEHKKQKICRTDDWRTFFTNYPPNKKGGRDTTAWNKFKTNKLTPEDLSAMIFDVEQRRALCPSWYETYAPGICKYLDEQIWLTPVIPEKLKSDTPMDRLTDDSWAGELIEH